jgi:hypothetical protein
MATPSGILEIIRCFGWVDDLVTGLLPDARTLQDPPFLIIVH